ncbi:hypothetical protein ACOMHN_020385 [Nucella lapillus]
MSMRKRKGTNRNEELKQLVNDVQHEGKGAAPSEGSASILRVGRSNLDIDVPHGGRMNCLVSPLRLSRLKQVPHWDLRAYAQILHVRVWRGSASRNEVSSFVKDALVSRRYVSDLLYSSLLHTGF